MLPAVSKVWYSPLKVGLELQPVHAADLTQKSLTPMSPRRLYYFSLPGSCNQVFRGQVPTRSVASAHRTQGSPSLAMGLTDIVWSTESLEPRIGQQDLRPHCHQCGRQSPQHNRHTRTEFNECFSNTSGGNPSWRLTCDDTMVPRYLQSLVKPKGNQEKPLWGQGQCTIS